MSLKLKVGAFFIVDAHYSYLRPHFLDFLKDIKSQKLKPSQLILMGDIFDALFGGVSKTIDVNNEAINLLNDISADIEVIYLEGNHDFNISKIFPNINIFAISKQPIECDYNNKKILLAHGDIESPIAYKLYTAVLRNKFTLFLLSLLNRLTKNKILNKLNTYLSKKNDCNEFINFEEFIKNRLSSKYKCDYFIEGHFHQNKSVKFDDFTYINLGAFACNQRYFSVKSSKELELLENLFSKESK
ncbi:MAG: UDP-2,3-diacylglucosamine diphosphatase [Campylobacterota bacterium]|nr:UDP-2,3-diacylglucosamine diphosphatase [Campylobacterota bacterium]